MTYKEKLAQANREARAAVIGLVLTIIVWIICGFGVSQFDVEVFNTPLWVLTGTFGTWIFAVIVSVVMAKRVFKDVGFDDIEQVEDLADEGTVRSSAEDEGAHDVR
jgi:uncharacterized membrane protein YhdT